MEKRIGREWWRVFAFDIETHADPKTIKDRKPGVWLTCMLDENSECGDDVFDHNIEEWLDRLERMTKPSRTGKKRKKANILIYVWNLAFEWSYIFPVLKKRGYVYGNVRNTSDGKTFRSTTTKTCSSVWQAMFRIKDGYGMVQMRDMHKLLPTGSLRSTAKSFGLETQKGEIDYAKDRTAPGYEPTELEKIYNFKDTKIVIELCQKIEERGEKEFWSSLSAGTWSMKKAIKRAWPNSLKPYREFRKRYPELSEEENEFIRASAEGGLTYATPRFQFKPLEKLCHYDAHQMHPSSAYLHMFPYGKGVHGYGRPSARDRLTHRVCYRVRVSYTNAILWCNVKLIGVPFVDDFEMTVWDIEIPTMRKCYEDLQIEYLEYYMYNMRPLAWREYLKENYALRHKAKLDKDPFGILFYKLMNNNTYGKLLERPHNWWTENIINDAGEIDSIEHPFDEEDERDNSTFTYLPAGTLIPAYSRVALIEKALALKARNVVYMDTDSLFFLDNQETRPLIGGLFPDYDDLGGWSEEEYILRCQFTAAKRYKLETVKGKGDGFLLVGQDVKIAGVTFAGDEPYDEVNIIDGTYHALTSTRSEGGTLLIPKEKKLKIMPKYLDIYKNNSRM